MKYENLIVEVRDGVAEIVLDRPDAGNALNLALARDFMKAALRCDEDPAVRAVLLRGAGRSFCVGGDLKSFRAAGDGFPSLVKEVTTYLHAAVSRLTRSRAPVVAAVHGSAAGAGMSIACACDFVIAAESARFTMAYTRIGLVPDGSSTYFLSRIVGLRRALELALTNRMLSASEARDLGIVTRVVPDLEVVESARQLAAEFARGPTLAFAATKRLLHSGFTETLETQMEYEARAIADVARTADAREGVAAFLEKRSPEYGNR